ncbi:DUF4136 domain-containing protein [Paucibacter sp. AS339]|uniref:DUF4136 domain-containing protein n=1 Tax=Paucibacter hankyongi TaxID=3133434 RepID=UPI0030AD944B
MNTRRVVLSGLAGIALLGLGACSGPYMVSSEVSSFGTWPEGRKPGSFFFERLPSQQMAGERADQQIQAENYARAVLLKAGFSESPDAKGADVLVSLGLRVRAQDVAPWDDPLWWRWHGNYNYWRYGAPGRHAYLYHPSDLMDRRYERSVAVLLRDRATSEPLYEARASNEGSVPGSMSMLSAMFEAAMSDFPRVRPEPHRVSVQAMR